MRSIGKLVYSPRSHLGSNEKWLVLMCDDEISKYYRTLYHREFFWKSKLTRPVWGAHCSIIRNENIPNKHLWGLEANQIIEFEYEPGVIDNKEYYWLRVKCKKLEDIRIKYGLTREPRFGYHLTVGRTTE